MNDHQILSGHALLGEDLLPGGWILLSRRVISPQSKKIPRAPSFSICQLFDAHTHLADTIATDCGGAGDLVSMVTPPDGLKHRLLSARHRKTSSQGCEPPSMV